MPQPPRPRTAPVQILHLAMPRTGSSSMMAAYKTLGLTTYHGFDFMDRPNDQIQWEKALDAKYHGKGDPFTKEDFDAFLSEFEVLSDFPVLAFTDEFIKWYPEAKVVLVDRDMQKWKHSFTTQVIAAFFTWKVWFMVNFLDPYFMTARPATTMRKLVFPFLGGSNRVELERNAEDTYKRQYESVRRLVPKERLLEYELGSGWGPLCEFLGKEVPGEVFPHKNEAREMEIWMHNTQMRVLKSGFVAAAKTLWVPVVVVLAAYVYVLLE